MRAFFFFFIAATVFCPESSGALPSMGKEWFQRLRDPSTRVEALWELEKKGKYPDSRDRFLAGGPIWIFKCPQKAHPEAWLVLRGGEYHRVSEKQWGPDPEVYPRHPEELKRRAAWMETMRERETMGEVWRPGEPWLNSVTGWLFDESGQQLAESFWIGAGVIADFNGDGFLDAFEVSWMSSTGKSEAVDGLRVGPLDHGEPRDRAWYCNFGKEIFRKKRDWKFRVEAEKEGKVALKFCPLDEGVPVVFTEELAKDERRPIYQVEHPQGKFHRVTKEFFKTIEESFKGVGTDDVCDLDMDLHVVGIDEFTHPFKLPDLEGLSPREAALMIARSNQDAVHRSQFDFRSAGEPISLPAAGWLEVTNDHGGWHPKSSSLWWLRDDRAECWKYESQSGEMILSKAVVPREEVRWMMALVGEIDQLRSVARHPLVTEDRKGGASWGDVPTDRVRLRSKGQKIPFRPASFYNWSRMDGRYGRSLAGIFAGMAVRSLPEGETGKQLDWREAGGEWLKGEAFREVPPALLRRFITLCGEKKWSEFRPRFIEVRSLLLAEGESGAAIERLEKIEEELLGWNVEDDLKKKRQNLLREQRDLRQSLVDDPRYELMEALDQALKVFESEAKK